MTHRTFIAVDPGAGGAIVVSSRGGVTILRNKTATRRDMIKFIKDAMEDAVNPVAYMEKVASFIPDGGASMMFEYGRMVERPGCILECFGCRIIEIIPRSWQGELGMGKSNRISAPRMPKGLSKQEKILWRANNLVAIESARDHNSKAKREWKAKLREEAQRRFPKENVTYQNCDALLLLDAAIKLEGEKLDI